jgi:hypothetical protein
MSKVRSMALLIAGCGAALGGCGSLIHAEAEETSLVLEQPIGQTIPGAPPVPVVVPQDLVTFTYDIPSVPLAGPSRVSNQAGFSVESSMKLNRAELIMRSSTADFNGIETLLLSIQNETGSASELLARYQRDPARPPGQTLVLVAMNVELLDYLSSTGPTRITLSISGSGTLPSTSWTADVDLHVRMRASAAWP